jgi:RNA polymerase sigma-70 factor (ECF subfamily)
MDAHDDRSDDELMTAYAGGDAAAFEALFQRHRKPLFTFLVHRCGDRQVAEDVLQEVFLKVIRSRATYRAEGSFRAWLFLIARRTLTDHHRQSAVRRVVTPQSALPDGAPLDLPGSEDDEPGRLAAARQLGTRITAALQDLPEEQREVFLLRERAGLAYEAIAEQTGCGVATAKSRMRYALAGLRRLLSAELSRHLEPAHD